MEQLKLEIEALQAENRKRKMETNALKAMLYVGIILLMFGFFYASETLHDAQELNIQSNFTGLQDQINIVEKGLFKDILSLEAKIEKVTPRTSPSEFRDAIRQMNSSLMLMEPKNPETRDLIENVLKNSGEFMAVYNQYSAQN